MSAAPDIRRLGPADLALVRDLNTMFGRAFEDAEHYGAAPPDDAYLARLLAKPDVIVLVAIAGGAVVGGLVAYAFDKVEQARREVYIYDLAVDAAYRRRGLATALIGRLREVAQEEGAWVIFVQADHGDGPAIALYTSLGTREDVLHFDIAPATGPPDPDPRKGSRSSASAPK